MEKKSILFEEEKKNGEEWRTYLREGKHVADGRVGGNQCNGSIRGPRRSKRVDIKMRRQFGVLTKPSSF